MKNISTVCIAGKNNFEQVNVHSVKGNEPKGEYYIFSIVSSVQEAQFKIFERKLPNGDNEKFTYVTHSDKTWHESKMLTIECDKLIVNDSYINQLNSYSHATLIVENNGTVNLQGGSSITIQTKSSNTLKITLTTPEYVGSTIKNTETLLALAQSVLNLQNNTSDKGYESFGLYRKVKKL